MPHFETWAVSTNDISSTAAEQFRTTKPKVIYFTLQGLACTDDAMTARQLTELGWEPTGTPIDSIRFLKPNGDHSTVVRQLNQLLPPPTRQPQPHRGHFHQAFA